MQQFNLNRFKKVVVRDFYTMIQQYGLTMLIMALLPVAVWLWDFIILKEYAIDVSSRETITTLIVELSAILAPSRIYRTINLPKDGIYYAMVPASKLEKFASMVLYCIFVAPLIVWGGLIAVDTLLTILPIGPYRSFLWQESGLLQTLPSLAPSWRTIESDLPWQYTFIISLGYPSMAALFMFTNTIFKKHKVTKTILSSIAILFVLTLISIPILSSFVFNSDYSFWRQTLSTGSIEQHILWGSLFLNIVWIVGLLIWSYARIKRMKY